VDLEGTQREKFREKNPGKSDDKSISTSRPDVGAHGTSGKKRKKLWD